MPNRKGERPGSKPPPARSEPADAARIASRNRREAPQGRGDAGPGAGSANRHGEPASSAGLKAGRAVALTAVLALFTLLAVRQVGSSDAGFHLKSGAYILAGHLPPSTDQFTYTIRDHAVVNPSWGYDVLLALLHGLFGTAGLVGFHAALVLAIFALVLATSRLAPADPSTAVTLLLLGGLASEMRFEVRPELVSYALLALVLHLLHRRAEGRVSPLWVLPCVHLLWANVHSLFVLGWVAAFCFVAGLALRDRGLDRKLVLWSALSIPATMINPYGWKATLFPITLATRLSESNVFAQSIGEFVSPFSLGLSAKFPFYPRLPIFAFRVLVVVAIAALVPLLARRRFHCVLLTAVFLALSTRMIRNLPLFAIASLPGTIWALPLGAMLETLKIRARTRNALARAALAAAVVFCGVVGARVVTGAYYVASRRPERFGMDWNRASLPVDAAAFAERAGLSGPVLNHLNFGGYLMWARPDPVFIDGRLEVVGEEFYKTYLAATSSEQALESCVARHGIRWWIFPYAAFPGLLRLASRSPHWRLAYVDHLAAVFVREDPGAAALVGEEARRETVPRPAQGPVVETLPGMGESPRPSPLGMWLGGLVRRQVFPAKAYNLGIFHIYRDDYALAQERFAGAIVESGGAYGEIYANLAAAFFRGGRLAEAEACYRVVLAEDPKSRIALDRLSEIRRIQDGRSPPARR